LPTIGHIERVISPLPTSATVMPKNARNALVIQNVIATNGLAGLCREESDFDWSAFLRVFSLLLEL
jgi:hypothetical protein